LAKIPFGSGGVKTKVTDYLFCGEFVLIGHKFQNIDQFLCQRGLYRPFVDHFRGYRLWLQIRKSNRIADDGIKIELLVDSLL
jgi:hypothetical protein